MQTLTSSLFLILIFNTDIAKSKLAFQALATRVGYISAVRESICLHVCKKVRYP